MDPLFKTVIWQQFGAAIDMLDDALRFCPDEVWRASLMNYPDEPAAYSEFWFIAYHTIFWLDLHLTGSEEGFVPPAPFKRGSLPEEPYTKAELRGYLAACRQRCQATIANLTAERAQQRCKYEWMEPTFAELLLYNMRHVQEHGAQLSLILGQHGIFATDWISEARE
jgi:hypothetical protein